MNIAVAIDGSDNALRAVEHAIMLVRHLPDAELEFLHVVDYNKAKDDYLLSQNPEGLALKREQKIHPATELAKSKGVEAKMTILKGNPSAEIIKHVNKEEVQQLIIGSRGLNTFQEMILGSVSHKVMKHVNCPVTIVK
ncbi:universal stress protein [Oceanobacillus alkalisoli]|uniref:universal stress protein n=1 Tax=Oceanobacillus alkalisoli TaxID=2925113 RepID=UPI001EF01FDF|nr:universal stress protein [Oceanobacillus alkalisoli]MCF3943694.1 universal stress protein [Oceanobacillus alkalisoli]MCG5104105.1 universal stress protein [Oceanobacillus alkalisoli]